MSELPIFYLPPRKERKIQKQSYAFTRRQAVPQRSLKTKPRPPRHPRPRDGPSQPQPAAREGPHNLKQGKRDHSDLLQEGCRLPERLALAGDNHVLSQDRLNDKSAEYAIVVSSLQRMVLHGLQAELVSIVGHIHNHGRAERDNTNRATELLERYCDYATCSPRISTVFKNLTSNPSAAHLLGTALQNLDYMAQRQRQSDATGERDPFEISSRDILSFRLMEETGLLPDRLDAAGNESRRYASLARGIRDRRAYDQNRNILPGLSRRERNDSELYAMFLERFLMGMLGGLALIGPMLIMVLHNDRLTTLLTTSVATLLFAGALAYWRRSTSGETVLAMVAAYAAVLVVFVGSNS